MWLGIWAVRGTCFSKIGLGAFCISLPRSQDLRKEKEICIFHRHCQGILAPMKVWDTGLEQRFSGLASHHHQRGKSTRYWCLAPTGRVSDVSSWRCTWVLRLVLMIPICSPGVWVWEQATSEFRGVSWPEPGEGYRAQQGVLEKASLWIIVGKSKRESLWCYVTRTKFSNTE